MGQDIVHEAGSNSWGRIYFIEQDLVHGAGFKSWDRI